MQVGLFEALNGRFADGTPLDAVGEDRHRLLSVIDNLNRLFNHRQDTLTHLRDYGLPDLSQTYRDNAETTEFIRKAIREAVETYEPRLRRVRVQRKPPDEHNEGWLIFLLSAEIVGGGRVQFETRFAEKVRVDSSSRY